MKNIYLKKENLHLLLRIFPGGVGIDCPANIYLFKVRNRNKRKTCEISSKLTIKTPERR